MSIDIVWKHDHIYRGKQYRAGEISAVDPSDYQTLVKAWLWAEKFVMPEPEPEPVVVAEPEPVCPEIETAALAPPEDEPETETATLHRGPGRPRKHFKG